MIFMQLIFLIKFVLDEENDVNLSLIWDSLHLNYKIYLKKKFSFLQNYMMLDEIL